MKKSDFIDAVGTEKGVGFPDGQKLSVPDSVARHALADTLNRVLSPEEEIHYLLEVQERPLIWLIVLRRDLAEVSASEEKVSFRLHTFSDVTAAIDTTYRYDPGNHTSALADGSLSLNLSHFKQPIKSGPSRSPAALLAFTRHLLMGRERVQ